MATYTVLGVWWMSDPICVGVIEGEHEVVGGNPDAFEEGLWATSVEAEDAYSAEEAAVAEMKGTLA